MTKPNYLFEHLSDPTFQDGNSTIALDPNRNRLVLWYGSNPGDWNTVAKYISQLATHRSITWCPDTNVAVLPATEPVWEALRIAAWTTNASTLITGVVEWEIKDWLDDPWRMTERATAIRAAMKAGSWITTFRMSYKPPIEFASYAYAHLLGVRRSLARPNAEGSTLVGTDPTDKSRTMNAIAKRIGKRAIALAKKGRTEHNESGVICINDELHCLMVIAHALMNRRDAVLLTADQDFLEIFYKAQWFYDTHYRAWLAARLVNEGLYGEPAQEFTNTGVFFRGPLTLYRRPTNYLQEVLPPLLERPIRVHVLYVAPNGLLHHMMFPFEPRMLDMLTTRGTTDGRCTDLFGPNNVHVDLGPLKPQMVGLYLGVGTDSTYRFTTNGITCHLSNLDLVHSINCLERHGVLPR